MVCKISATLKKSTNEERRNGYIKYQNQIIDISFEENKAAGGGGFSSVASLFLNYIESSRE